MSGIANEVRTPHTQKQGLEERTLHNIPETAEIKTACFKSTAYHDGPGHEGCATFISDPTSTMCTVAAPTPLTKSNQVRTVQQASSDHKSHLHHLFPQRVWLQKWVVQPTEPHVQRNAANLGVPLAPEPTPTPRDPRGMPSDVGKTRK